MANEQINNSQQSKPGDTSTEPINAYGQLPGFMRGQAYLKKDMGAGHGTGEPKEGGIQTPSDGK